MVQTKKCCFTGYRPAKFDFPFSHENAEYVKFENDLVKTIGDAISDRYDTFYCGGAMGFDILAAEIVLLYARRADVKIIMAVPYRAQSAGFTEDWRLRYDRLLTKASEIIYVSEEYSPDCYGKRNRYMVDNSDAVIAFCDGKPGGTLNTVRYAQRQGKKIINLASLPAEQLTFFEIIE